MGAGELKIKNAKLKIIVNVNAVTQSAGTGTNTVFVDD
jgi:hypothetical protein